MKDFISKSFVCTKENPWDGNIPGLIPAQHPDAVYVRDEYDDTGNYAIYDCPYCNLRFKVMLPDA